MGDLELYIRLDLFSPAMQQRIHVRYNCKGSYCVVVNAAKRAVPHLLAHKLVTTIAKKRETKTRKGCGRSQEPGDTGGIDINTLVDGSAY